MSLQGRSVVVTGAGTGIGRAIAERALKEGALVTAVGRRRAALEELATDGAAQAVPEDVAAPGAAGRIVRAAVERFGALHGVVNNAGLARFARLEEAGPEEFDRMLAVNVRAPAELIRSALPHLRAARGAVVNVSSVGGVLSMPGRSFYGASKAALNSLTRSLARELAPEVRVNAVLPGPVDTPMWEEAGLTPEGRRDLRESLLAATPMGRFGTGEEIARWVCQLLDPDLAGWITGALVPVDGGRTT
ncbi:SDR family oxidoreductase [Actinomadura sp. ATCC 31491]|uniref:SDR family oxidoreductase n=1 Tax=Actinomadura luzonensis TaxID=2805427 RepID=A0ABT0FVF7_9ACTN|nr:SDR family NAD(P)-dependent oxidoreductase [Actinomadura luzonensis]MCK2216168.1 SDR family oxidoreductase [Actinomadura luzonensis]UKU09919.1 Luz21 [Actinomadura luzonensis]